MEGKKGLLLLGVLLVLSSSLAVVLVSPVGAVTLTSISPTSGNVGTVVRVVGVIDTLGGQYQIGFDVDDDGNAFETGEIMVTANAPQNSFSVNKTFTVPSCVGNDAGEDHLVGLKDTTTAAYKTTPFYVKTKRAISAPRRQEGVAVPINVTETGGVATTLYNYTVAVTDPKGSTFKHYNFSFTSDGNGRGTVVKNYPTVFPAGAHTNYTGTYNMVANETAPGTIANAATGSFLIGLTNATEYRIFETVNVRTAGWTPGQKLNITVKDPTAKVVKSWTLQTATYGTWTGDWTIPWNATMGTYTVEVKNHTGNDKAIHSIQTFTVVSIGVLTVTITDQPLTSYQRTQTAIMKFTVKFPDGKYYTSADLGTIRVRVYYGTTWYANISLTSADFNPATKKWTATWLVPWNAPLRSDYKFTVYTNEVVDKHGNSGPAAPVSSSVFEVIKAVLIVPAIYTDKTIYEPEQNVTIYFKATYFNGSFVTTGSAAITLTKPDGATVPLTAYYVAARNRFEATYLIAESDPLGTWTAKLGAQGLKDGADNTGPATDRTTTFKTALPPTVIMVHVKIRPKTLNLRSKGKWITAYIKLPDGYSANAIDLSTIRINGTVAIDMEAPIRVKDQKLIVKFDRNAVIELIRGTLGNTKHTHLHKHIHLHKHLKFNKITLTITGEVDGRAFQGSDTIKVII